MNYELRVMNSKFKIQKPQPTIPNIKLKTYNLKLKTYNS